MTSRGVTGDFLELVPNWDFVSGDRDASWSQTRPNQPEPIVFSHTLSGNLPAATMSQGPLSARYVAEERLTIQGRSQKQYNVIMSLSRALSTRFTQPDRVKLS